MKERQSELPLRLQRKRRQRPRSAAAERFFALGKLLRQQLEAERRQERLEENSRPDLN